MNKNSKIHPSCLNIEGERVEYDTDKENLVRNNNKSLTNFNDNTGGGLMGLSADSGRFPSQLLISPEAAVILDEQTGIKTSKPVSIRKTNQNSQYYGVNNKDENETRTYEYNDTGGGSKILHQVWFSDYEIYEIENNFEMYKNNPDIVDTND